VECGNGTMDNQDLIMDGVMRGKSIRINREIG
jgi:hypothetical protein